MTTYRVQHRTKDFTQVQNATVRDTRLSFRARGVLVWLLSHVDEWEVSREQIARNGTEGVAAIRTAEAELKQFGYLERVQIRNSNGTVRYVTNVYETPGQTAGWLSANGSTANGSTANGQSHDIEDHLSEDHLKEDQLFADQQADPARCSRNDLFNLMWDNWPTESKKKGSKGDALKAIEKLSPAQRVIAAESAARHIDLVTEHPGRYAIPYVSTWLNKGRYHDAQPMPVPAGTKTAGTMSAREHLKAKQSQQQQGEQK